MPNPIPDTPPVMSAVLPFQSTCPPVASLLTSVSVARKRRRSAVMPDLAERLAALEQRVGELEDLNAIRRLHWAYGYYIDFNRAEDVVQLFARNGSVVFLSGEY